MWGRLKHKKTSTRTDTLLCYSKITFNFNSKKTGWHSKSHSKFKVLLYYEITYEAL